MIYGFVLLFLVVNLLFFWLDRKIDREITDIKKFLHEHENKINMLIQGLEAKEDYDFRYTFPKNIYRSHIIDRLNEDIKRLHNYLGVKLEPPKTEPERLVKVKKEVGK